MLPLLAALESGNSFCNPAASDAQTSHIHCKVVSNMALAKTIAALTMTAGLLGSSMTNAAKLPADNPFAKPSTLPYQLPPFDKIKNDDFKPALESGMEEQL